MTYSSNVGVVMCYWNGDIAISLREAIISIVNQTIPPDKFLIVRDGPVTKDLSDIVSSFLSVPYVEHLILEDNNGRGIARHTGILACNCDYVALMDADDISVTNRLSQQKNFLDKNPNIDVLGGYICEKGVKNKMSKYRIVPLSNKEIINFGRFKQPFNHVTIMFKKCIYIKSGGYSFFKFVEDYDFFHRLYLANSTFANLPEILVNVRPSGNSRIQGYKYFREELLLQLLMYKSRYINIFIFFRNIIVRFVFRSLPGRIQRLSTSLFLRNNKLGYLE